MRYRYDFSKRFTIPYAQKVFQKYPINIRFNIDTVSNPFNPSMIGVSFKLEMFNNEFIDNCIELIGDSFSQGLATIAQSVQGIIGTKVNGSDDIISDIFAKYQFTSVEDFHGLDRADVQEVNDRFVYQLYENNDFCFELEKFYLFMGSMIPAALYVEAGLPKSSTKFMLTTNMKKVGDEIKFSYIIPVYGDTNYLRELKYQERKEEGKDDY